MQLEETLGAIEGCDTVDALRDGLQRIIGAHGFASYAFVEISDPGAEAPLLIATSDPRWNEDYRSNGFLHVDPVLPMVRRANRPFTWADVVLPRRLGKRKSGALRTMEAARDHGLVEGLVVPFHTVDRIGRMHSASCVLFWKDRPACFARVSRRARAELHVVLIYWAGRVLELAAEAGSRRFEALGPGEDRIALSDRERAALTWAARGKTMAETAAILSISVATVESHLRNAMAKLDTVNKTQAAVRALKLGLIDV